MPSQCKASELVELLERGDPDDFDRIMALLQADEVSAPPTKMALLRIRSEAVAFVVGDGGGDLAPKPCFSLVASAHLRAGSGVIRQLLALIGFRQIPRIARHAV